LSLCQVVVKLVTEDKKLGQSRFSLACMDGDCEARLPFLSYPGRKWHRLGFQSNTRRCKDRGRTYFPSIYPSNPIFEDDPISPLFPLLRQAALQNMQHGVLAIEGTETCVLYNYIFTCV